MPTSSTDFRTLVEHLPDLVVLHRQGVVAFVNQAVVRALEYATADELVGRHVAEFVHPEDRAVLADRLRIVSEASGPLPRAETRYLTKTGRVLTIETAPVPNVVFDGLPTSLVVGRDVTERKEMEQELLASERLASVGSLAACVAHELNNPLTYVMGNLSYAARGLAQLVPAVQGDEASLAVRMVMALGDAREGLERMRRIVGDLTLLALPELEEERVLEVRRVLESSLGVASNEIRHRARLERAIAELPPVRANAVRLGLVFVNLLLLAARSITEGAALDHVVYVEARTTEDGWAEIVFSTPRTDEAREADPPGRKPAGLAIATTIVESLGGRLVALEGADDRVGQRVLLPPSAEEPKAEPRDVPPPPLPPPPAGTKLRILVVDDEPVIAATLRRTLEDHDIYIVTSGRDALELCREQVFDLVLCDLMIPDLTGMDLYEELRQDAAGREQRIVFMTGGAFTERARRFLATVPWLSKPFDVDEIQAVVQKYFGLTVLLPR